MLVKFGRFLPGILRRTSPSNLAKRDFAQVGMLIATPPRVRMSYGEKILHGAVMILGWTTPVAWFITQIIPWREKYVKN